MHVEIHAIDGDEDRMAGVLRLQGGTVVPEPDSLLMRNILAEPVLDWTEMRNYWPREQPEQFLRTLYLQYRSPYLRASKAIEDDRGETVTKSYQLDDGEDAASHLATRYAEDWNLLREHDEYPSHAELHHASEELSGTHWRVTRRPDGEWVAHHYQDKKPLRAWKGYEPAVMKEAEHAPKGGIALTINGQVKFFMGGQWIPAKDIANLPPAEKAKLEAARNQAKMGRIGRGDINAQSLAGQLRPHARKLSQEENRRAVGELRALHNYHGGLTLHRIQELANQQQAFLKRKNLTDKQKQQIEGNLARLHAMAVSAHKLGVTGKIPPEMMQQGAVNQAKQAEIPAKEEKPKPETIPVTAENHPANPNASGVLNAKAFAEQPQFQDKDGKIDEAKAQAAMKEIARRHESGGGKVEQVEGGLRFTPAEKSETAGPPAFFKQEWLSRTPDQAARLAKDAAIAAGKNPEEVERVGRAAFDYAHKNTTNRNSIYQRELLRGEKAGLSEEDAKQRARDAVEKASPGALPEDAAKALATQAGHVAQPKEGSDAASEFNRKLIEEGKEKPQPKKMTEEEEQRLARNKERLARAMAGDKAPSQTHEEQAFNDAWNKAFNDDPEAQKLSASGDKGKARERVLARMIEEGEQIPDRIKEKFADAYQNAMKSLRGESEQQAPAEKPTESKPAEPEDEELRRQSEGAKEKLRRGSEKDARRYWGDKAFEEGIQPKDLHTAADHIVREDAEHVDRRKKMLARARELLKHYGYNPEALTTNIRKGNVEDESHIKAIDLVARTIQNDYPEEFEGYDLPEQKLIEYFEQGVPKPISRDDAYEKALDYLREQKEQGGSEGEMEPWEEDKWLDDEDANDFAFGANQYKSLRAWIQKGRRAKPSGPMLPGMGESHFDPVKHPHQPAGPHGGQFAPTGTGGGGMGSARGGETGDRPLFHVTKKELKDIIIREGLKAGTREGLELGPGVYLARDAERFPVHLRKNSTGEEFETATIEVRLKPGTKLFPLDSERPNQTAAIYYGLFGNYDQYEKDNKAGLLYTQRGLPNWPHLHSLLKEHGYGGIERTEREGDVGNTDMVVFDPKDIQVKASPAPQGKVAAALERYASRDKTALGGGLFGGEDMQARKGFAQLPDGAPIVFTSGEHDGQTGKIVRDTDALTGAPRIVAEVDGKPGLVPVSPDAVEPLDVRQSWRVEGGGAGREETQGGLYGAEHYLPRR